MPLGCSMPVGGIRGVPLPLSIPSLASSAVRALFVEGSNRAPIRQTNSGDFLVFSRFFNGFYGIFGVILFQNGYIINDS